MHKVILNAVLRTLTSAVKLIVGKRLLVKLLYLYADSTENKVDNAVALVVDGALNLDEKKLEEGVLWLFDQVISRDFYKESPKIDKDSDNK